MQASSYNDLSFRPTDLSLMEVANALSSGSNDVIYAKPARERNPDRWNIFNAKTGKIAIFNHVFLWGWGSPRDTGNFVPRGCVVPDGLPETRIQQVPSNLCEWSYAFNVTEDKSVFDAVTALEEYTRTIENFNPSGKNKVAWQSGESSDAHNRYIMTAKVFVKRTDKNCSSDGTYNVPYDIHPWIRNNLNPLRNNLVPNKDRPRLFSLGANNALIQLDDADPNRFLEGDVVWVSFKAHYSIRPRGWSVQFTPLEIVRIGHGAGLSNDDDDDYAPLEVGVPLQQKSLDEEGEHEADEDEVQESQPPPLALAVPASPQAGEKRKPSQEVHEDDVGGKIPRQHGMAMDVEEEVRKELDVTMEGGDGRAVRGRRGAGSRR
ncbi:hypothetical protein BKA70DRAFT_1432718 [Coprinopsis sp. MPI-PUGE-AT-0042]|nr:hypothetical protein BKA70DRAFT_1432718 [Coprinopsis sp. MPI-PUGE-AT-0042]